MANLKRALGLQILVDGKSYDRVLQAGEKVIVGRDASAQVLVPDDSISSQHLELNWDGEKIHIRDMESSNGTYRMPQDSPFLGGKFDPSTVSEIKFRVSKIHLEFSWFLLDENLLQSERTQVLETLIPANENLDSEAVKRPAQPPSAKSNPQIKKEAPLSKSPVKVPSASPLLLAGFTFSLASCAYYFFKYADFTLASWARLRLGQSVDLYLFWLDELPLFASFLILSIAVFIILKKKDFAFPSISQTPQKVFGVGFFIVPFLIPVFALLMSAKPLETFQAASRYRDIRSSLPKHDFSNKEENLALSSEMNQLSRSLMGSSVYYAFWHNFQKKRVISECGGVGSGTWQKKRFCLTLLFALSLESLSKIRPVYMRGTASNLVLLSSLDGVVRVLAAEGPESDHLKVFINSLDDVGLVDEVRAFLSLVQSFKGQKFEDLMKALLEVRLQLEARLTHSQSQRDLPRQLSLNLMGPLEMGI